MRRNGSAALAAAALAILGLAGTPRAQDEPMPHVQPPMACTCEITAEVTPGKVVVAGGQVKVELKVKGSVKSGPKSKDKITPTVTIKSTLMWKTAGGKWQRVPGTDVNVVLEELTCGADGKFDKDTYSPAAGAVADSGAVDYELHLFVLSAKCKMKPVVKLLTFQVAFGGKKGPAPGAVATVGYAPSRTPDKKNILVSAATGVGWYDDESGTPYVPAGM